MTSINRTKIFVENASYHIYNRGVNKQKIFLYKEDYGVYLKYMGQYLLPPEVLYKQLLLSKAKSTEIVRVMNLKNYSDTISVMAFCLMPNHVHIIIEQTSARMITNFMHSLHTRYAMYVNRKYKRVGCLFEDIYKARQIKDRRDLLSLSAYIHRNPSKLTNRLESYKWSSLSTYCNDKQMMWLSKKKVMKAFSKSPYEAQYKSYLDFVKAGP